VTSDAQEKLRTGGGVLSCQKKRVWEKEGSLSARWMMSLVPVQRYDLVAKGDLRKNFAKNA